VRFLDEQQYSVYNFEKAGVPAVWQEFDLHEAEARRLLDEYAALEDPAQKARFPLLPTYDQVLKCSNLFNTLDARRAISVTERVAVIQRVRTLAVGLAQAWMNQREVAA
jgi:glycyl-tRNA synthetase alpha chain